MTVLATVAALTLNITYAPGAFAEGVALIEPTSQNYQSRPAENAQKPRVLATLTLKKQETSILDSGLNTEQVEWLEKIRQQSSLKDETYLRLYPGFLNNPFLPRLLKEYKSHYRIGLLNALLATLDHAITAYMDCYYAVNKQCRDETAEIADNGAHYILKAAEELRHIVRSHFGIDLNYGRQSLPAILSYEAAQNVAALRKLLNDAPGKDR